MELAGGVGAEELKIRHLTFYDFPSGIKSNNTLSFACTVTIE
jgi:hypothetical protein